MRILMATNTYLPHVGGVANAVDRMTRSLRKMGHEIVVVAPGDDPFGTTTVDADNVIRIPALKGVAGSDFSMPFAKIPELTDIIRRFSPDIVHTHHPFLLGEVALQGARRNRRPVCFTHHTLYEHYNQWLPGLGVAPGAKLAAAVASYATTSLMPVVYANRVDALFVPTKSVAALAAERGVTTPTYITPTGIDIDIFGKPDGTAARKKLAIDSRAFVIGHVGRLSKEKGLTLLANAMALFLRNNESARAIIVGKGPCSGLMQRIFQKAQVSARVRWPGVLRGQALANAFGAMDVFAFASTSETQGLVLAEAMAAGVPVIALDASGVRDIVVHGENGLITDSVDPADFARALLAWSRLPAHVRAEAGQRARKTGASYALELTTKRLVGAYEHVLARV